MVFWYFGILTSKIISFSVGNFGKNALEITRMANIPPKSPKLQEYPQNENLKKKKKINLEPLNWPK